MNPGGARLARVKVWDVLVRVCHWALALCILGTMLTQQGGTVHETMGYGVLGIVAVRIAWGFAGSPHARFRDFVSGAPATLRYAGLAMAGREPRYLGHNPLGGWMILALLLTATIAAGSGALYVTDRFWGVAWVEDLHSISSHALIPLVALHVAGVIHASIRHRENLVATMVHGWKAPVPTETPSNPNANPAPARAARRST